MNTEIKAIISDMDDTLLNDEGKLSDYTVATLRECIRRGIHVIPASGRTQTSVAPYAAQIGVDCPYIACNGKNFKIPRSMAERASELTIEECRKIMSEPPKKKAKK